MPIRAYVLDDEPLAVRRLERLLAAPGRVTVVGSSSDPEAAIEEIAALRPEVLFLDIEMPGLTGFDLLARLPGGPLVIFTTAYDQYALRAFGESAIDYLVKPVEEAALDRAIAKARRMLAAPARTAGYPARLPSRVGERVEFVDLAKVSHFYAEDKLTYAATGTKAYVVDPSIAELEARLDPERWFRIHRSTLVQLEYVQEVHGWIGHRLLVRLKDDKKTELPVARDRVQELKARLGI